MAENILLGLGHTLLRIHKVISRGLIVSVRCAEDYLQVGLPASATRHGYVLYLQALVVVLGAHHLGEDEVAFPALREKVTAAPFDRLARNHQAIEAMLGSLKPLVPPLETDNGQADLVGLLDLLHRISDLWRPHIQTEEFYFSDEALAAVMSLAEGAQLGAAMAKHGQEHSSPAHLGLPFVLYNLEPEDRAVMAASMPPMVINELIPNTWKELWAPMKSFLLE